MADLRWATLEDIEAVSTLLEEYHRQEGLRGHTRERIRSVLEDLFEVKNRGRVAIATVCTGRSGRRA